MKKLILLIVLVGMLGLAACSGGVTPTTAPVPTAIPTSKVDPTNAVLPTAKPVQTGTLGKLGDPTACNVVGLLPDPNPGLPAVSDADWFKGNRDARVTILEYSDYQ